MCRISGLLELWCVAYFYMTTGQIVFVVSFYCLGGMYGDYKR